MIYNLKFLRYSDLTSSSLVCKLKGSQVGVFNASLLVSEDNGRSLSISTAFFVTPNEIIYNFQSYAGIFDINIRMLDI